MSRGDQVNTVVDNHLPDDWDDTPARREQILSVVEYFLETPTEMGLRERRIRAQRKAANDLDVAFKTIQSKCGRETWAEYVDSSDDYQRDHLEPALESISAELAGERDEQTQTTDRPSVWIEKTEQEGRRYKKEGKLRLGQAIYSPSEAKNGADVYSTMREAEVGDIVLHLLQDQYEIVGVSTIASELETDFEGLPEFGWEDHQKGYRRWLTGYEELTEPLNIYESVLDSVEHRERLDEIREEHTKLFYNSNRSLVQGGYLTQCPPELANIIAHESPEIAEQLSRRGYETTPEEVTMSSAETYDGIKEATTDVADRLSTRTTGPAWFDTQLTESIIEDWTTTLRGFEVGSKVTPEEEVRLQQIRTLYTVAESELSDRVDEIGSGSLENSLPEETLFMTLVRLRQDQSGHLPNLNGHKMEILLDEEYQVVAPEETGTSHQQNGAESDAGVGKSGGSGS